MEVYSAIAKRRAIRQFEQKKIPRGILRKLGDAGRLAPSAANLQPLVFLIVDESKRVQKISSALKWAAHLKGWAQPKEKRPVAYVFILADTTLKKAGYEYDAGLAAENIMIAATGFNLGSCCLGVVHNKKAVAILAAPDRYAPTLAIALGYPKEKSRAEDMKDSVKYFRDANGVLHVPKRKSGDVVRFNALSK